jgi:hypothetical protein
MATNDNPRTVTPWSFTEALEAAGIVHDRNRISEIVIRARPAQAVMIEVTYFADERIYALTNPAGPVADHDPDEDL